MKFFILSLFSIFCILINTNAKSISNNEVELTGDFNNETELIESECEIDFLYIRTKNTDGCSDSETGYIWVIADCIRSNDFDLSIDNGANWKSGQDSIGYEDLSSGSYFLIVRDRGGCQVVYDNNPVVLIIDDPVSIVSIETTPQTNSSLGSITVTPEGQSPFRYRINSGTWQTDSVFTDLATGTYDVDIKDKNGCIVYDEATVEDERCPEFSVDVTHETNCNTPNGTLTFTATGLSPFLYSIDNGSTWQSDSAFTELSAALYYVAVQSTNGCVTYDTKRVNNALAKLSLGSHSDDATCIGTETGDIVSWMYAGKFPYAYSIDTGITWQSDYTFYNLPAGDYMVIGIDSFLCTDTIELTINNPDHDTITYISTLNVLDCAGDETGIIVINGDLPESGIPELSEGTAPDNYSIDGGVSWQSENIFENLPAGEYNAVVDVGGCEYEWMSNPIIITEPDELIFLSITLTPDDGTSNGAISIRASGGTSSPGLGSYTYSIDGGSTSYSTNVFSGLEAGEYDLVITDDNGCTKDSTVTLEEDTCPVFDGTGASGNTNCSSPNGRIIIYASSVVGGLMYSIDDGATWQSDSLFTGLPAGEYNIWIKDANACEVEEYSNPYIISDDFISISGSKEDAQCIGDATGSISCDCSSGSYSYEYSIDDGSTWQTEDGDFAGLVAGGYVVIGRDGYGCTDTAYFEIGDPAHDTISYIITQNVLGCAYDETGIIAVNDSIEVATGLEGLLEASASTTNYSIDNGSTWQTGSIFENLTAGEYYTKVKVDGCEYEWALNPVIITEPDPLSFDGISITDDDGSPNGEIEITASGGTGSIYYSITGGASYQSSPIFTGLSYGFYDLSLKDDNDCLADSTVEVPATNPVVNIPDSIFKDYLVKNTSINTNGDTEIQVSEAEVFNGMITVTNLGIYDLTGIEEFIELKYLYCQTNYLTEIDISNNTELLTLYCGGNNLTELDVTSNTKIKSLSCNDNEISSLDVSYCTSLELLHCAINLLSELDVSNNINLEKLYCYTNLIDTLDLCNNDAIYTIDCKSNNLTSLDVRNGNNSIITTFKANDNYLTCISVSDVSFATTNWTNIDSGVSFSEDCDTPETDSIAGTTFELGDSLCFGATLTITVGGEGSDSVDFEPGSSTTLIAGGSITFLPGTHIQSGSYLWAFITTDGSFCDVYGPSSVEVIIPEKSAQNYYSQGGNTGSEIFNNGIVEEIALKVYPNPNDGRFNLELTGFSDQVELFIFNSLGAVVKRIILREENTEIELMELKQGIYFVKACGNEGSLFQKIIIHNK